MRIGDYLIQAWRMSVASRWIVRNSRVLDIGCHQGEFFEYLAKKISPSVGIDPLLEREGTQGSHELLKLILDGQLPFPDDSFDAVVLLATIEHMQNKSVVAKESFRLLRPGGRVVITVPSLMVDKILDVLVILRLVDGMSLEEHHGFMPDELPKIFMREGFKPLAGRKFQFGLNNLFVFEKPYFAGRES
ncbi:MAG: methyltransferase domain-containing protein [Chloroflexi bacterium]|nr:methyltransferase domain-containing protein [Chloroflexota bacterium]